MRTRMIVSVLTFVAAGSAFAQDLTYNAFARPCRLVDTRSSSAGFIESGTPRHFVVVDGDFQAQGGTPEGCGVPLGAAAAVLNFVAVTPAGTGNLRASAYPAPIPATGSIINYALLNPNLNIANGLQFPLCTPEFNADTQEYIPCEFDISVQPNGSGTHLVVDVLGYYLPGRVTDIVAGTGITVSGTGAVTVGISNNGVGAAQLADDSVDSAAVQDRSLSGHDIALGAITHEELANNAVYTAAIQAGAVTGDKISAALAMFSGRVNNLGTSPGLLFGGATGSTSPTEFSSAVYTLSPNRACVAQNFAAELSAAPGLGNSREFFLRVGNTISVGCVISDANVSCTSPAGDTALVPAASRLSIYLASFASAPLAAADVWFGWECR